MITVVNKRGHKSTPWDLYIGRPSLLGNPFPIGKDGNRDEVCDKYETYLAKGLSDGDAKITRGWNEARLILNQYGKLNLVCFCKPLRCHGDFLKKAMENGATVHFEGVAIEIFSII